MNSHVFHLFFHIFPIFPTIFPTFFLDSNVFPRFFLGFSHVFPTPPTSKRLGGLPAPPRLVPAALEGVPPARGGAEARRGGDRGLAATGGFGGSSWEGVFFL